MSKPAPHRSYGIRQIWRLVNLVLLTIGFLIPVIHDQNFGSINYLNILTMLFWFLPGVVFQALSTPTKLPGLFLYLGGLLSLISIVVYLILGIITFSLQSSSLLKRSRRRTLPSLLLIIMSGIGVFAVLFLWQGHLTPSTWVIVAALISCLILEGLELRSMKPKLMRSNR